MKSYYLFFLIFLTACQSTQSNHYSQDKPSALRGVYKLLSLQAQNETVFKPMKNVEILKVFTDGSWVSVAYSKTNKQVIYSQGGVYTYAHGQMHETIQYHSKDTQNIGITTTYNVVLSGKTFHQSGIFKAGTPDAWKVEEYWTRVGE
ncbi:MAG TPA: hypothetical protein VHG71_11085 [Verrucomicrobiae bacterium]|nr:hypothetical protein [Verrucomicrobiae bacterium]